MVSVVAEVKKAGKFGCMVNYNEPSIYSEDEVIDFSTDAKEAEYLVVADEEKKKIEVFKNNESVFETEYIPSERHGVYIVMKDYDIILKKTAVKKLNTDNV